MKLVQVRYGFWEHVYMLYVLVVLVVLQQGETLEVDVGFLN